MWCFRLSFHHGTDSEELPPSGSVPPPTTTTTAAGVGPPGPGAGISTTASSTPGTQAVSLPGVPQQQFVISSSNSGLLYFGKHLIKMLMHIYDLSDSNTN